MEGLNRKRSGAFWGAGRSWTWPGESVCTHTIRRHVSIDRRMAYPGIIKFAFDHQLGLPMARKVASISSSERPAITSIAPSWAAVTPSMV